MNLQSSFQVGHCYYNAKEPTDSPDILLCRKSILYGLKLVPTSGILKFSIPCNSAEVAAGEWIDCTEEAKRSEAMKNCEMCPLVPISNQYVGTVIAYPIRGEMSAPVFLYAYSNGMAHLMSLDGRDKVFNLRLTNCFPLQRMYRDIAERAVSPDPLSSSIFDGFLKWLGKTPQYNTFISMVEDQAPDNKEDMIRLFELMSYDGITASNFEMEVQRRYDALQANEKEDQSKYAAVLANYRSPAQKYSKVEKEIMRATSFQYKTPKEAWEHVGGGKPFPSKISQVIVEHPPTPHQYVCDKLGLYDGNSNGYWFSCICPALEAYFDLETDYIEVVEKYLAIYPEFDMKQLSFITEPDKEAVFCNILGCQSLKAEDPFRAWTNNPPDEFKLIQRENPALSYVEIFREVYEKQHK